MTEKTEKKVPDARQSFIYPAKGVSHKSGFEESLVSAEAAVPEVEGGTAIAPPSNVKDIPRKPLSERFAREEKQ
jgi:hypothetical protein